MFSPNIDRMTFGEHEAVASSLVAGTRSKISKSSRDRFVTYVLIHEIAHVLELTLNPTQQLNLQHLFEKYKDDKALVVHYFATLDPSFPENAYKNPMEFFAELIAGLYPYGIPRSQYAPFKILEEFFPDLHVFVQDVLFGE